MVTVFDKIREVLGDQYMTTLNAIFSRIHYLNWVGRLYLSEEVVGKEIAALMGLADLMIKKSK